MDNVFEASLRSQCARTRPTIRQQHGQNEFIEQADNENDNTNTQRQHPEQFIPPPSSSKKALTISRRASTASASSFSFLLAPRILKTVNLADFEKDAKDILRVVRPLWIEQEAKHGKSKSIRTSVLSGGITNKLYAFSRPTDPEPKDIVVIKVYGENTDKLINRADEIENLELLFEYDCAPQLYAIFDNGICYEYLHGRALDWEKCYLNQVYSLVAKEVARLHNVPLEVYDEDADNVPDGTKNTISKKSLSLVGSGCAIWDKMRQLVDLLDKEILLENPGLRKRLECESKLILDKVKQDIDQLEELLEKQGIPVAFCHNDLLFGNVIYNEVESKVRLIDFEYAMPNYIAYDVANHFNEYAGLRKPDYSNLPDANFKRSWIKEYLKHYEGSDKQNITERNFEKWVDMSTPASHLFWALWAIVQAGQSKNIDFDYAGYAGIRYREYQRSLRSMDFDDVS